MGKPKTPRYSLIAIVILFYVSLRIYLMNGDDLCRVCVAFYCAFSPITFDAIILPMHVYFLNKLFIIIYRITLDFSLEP